MDKCNNVFFMSGGTIDDNVASILLQTMNISMNQIQISNSDTIYRFGMQNQWKIQKYLNKKINISLSKARAFNPFPWQYRNDSYLIYTDSIINSIPDNNLWPKYPDGERALYNYLENALTNKIKITILVTAPLTPLTNVLKKIQC